MEWCAVSIPKSPFADVFFACECSTKWCALIHFTICTMRARTHSFTRTQLLMLVHYYHCLLSIECNCGSGSGDDGSNHYTNPIFPNCIPLLFWQLCLIVVFSIPKQNFVLSLSLPLSLKFNYKCALFRSVVCIQLPYLGCDFSTPHIALLKWSLHEYSFGSVNSHNRALFLPFFALFVV